ncbi:MAG: hypothetical protein GY853_14995 [PVC group bacterium]|nr:hypothetical protein [PVC group bacterium]
MESYLDLVANITIIIVALAALSISVRSMKRANIANHATGVAMYTIFNNTVAEDIKSVGPITPYKKSSNEDNDSLRRRIHYLGLFNRWRFDIDSDEEKAHIKFRKDVMGESINDFAKKIMNKGYSEDVAIQCVNVLKEIFKDEPYYRVEGENFWNVYFDRYDWEVKEVL